MNEVTAISTNQRTQEDIRPVEGVADMAPLIRRLREFVARREDQAASRSAPYDRAGLTQRFGFAEKKKGSPDIVLAGDVAVELGHPNTVSHAILLTTFKPENIEAGRITVIGPGLDQLKASDRNPFSQIILLALNPDRLPDPFEISNAQYLMNRLPGYMVRAMPGRLWVRISKKSLAAGMSLEVIGSALVNAYAQDFPEISGVEVVFVTSDHKDVEALNQLHIEADILAGRHKKLALGFDGEVECRELDCDVCVEKPVCDSLRDVVIKRRKIKKH